MRIHIDENDCSALTFLGLMLLIFAILGPKIYFDEKRAVTDLNDEQIEELKDFRLDLARLEPDDFVSVMTDEGVVDYIVSRQTQGLVYLRPSKNDHPSITLNPLTLANAREWEKKITFIVKKEDDGWEAFARHFFLC